MCGGSLVIVSSSCQHHHVNNVVGKSISPLGAVENSNSSETREFTGGENTLGRETLRFSRVKWLLGSAKTVCSESSISQKNTPTKKRNVRSGVESPALREGWSTWRDASAARGCNWLWQNALARLHAAKPKSCCHAPGKRDCSWMLLNVL